MNDEFEPVPSHFFERGPYEIWANKTWGESGPKVLISGGLCWASARAFSWPHAEIRKDGKVVTEEGQ